MYERFTKSRIEEVFADTRVVLISELRQSGKTTLATDTAAANDDPVGFLRGMGRGVIDEIQRVPDFIDQLRTTDATNQSRKIPIFQLGNAL